ncbi:Reverse transcriptase RNA-dependent DNA polymerase [Penicillium brasilianum]|uniref:Reverse transcriptase RNA-dependent DNA polymerase n=1 Tax=Penicillium brasilianum TaxID=104259 RepID=A0A1S9RI25_PENBI|nr:Reverse transcriptase RNA-dependent DNA polymerase [Penicillium brasilianum]
MTKSLETYRSRQLSKSKRMPINNSDFDYSAYLPSSLGKHDRDDSSDNDHDDKRHRALAAFYHAFSANQQLPKQLAISSLPPALSDYGYLRDHPYQREFRQAMQVEFNKLLDMQAFEPISADLVNRSYIRECGQSISQKHCPKHQLIPMRWVFNYKSDESGNLTRFKARLCVRGDQQSPDFQDARTSTLAARTFRTLIALMTKFDLETFQMDAVNAFLNSKLDQDVFCRYPPGLGSTGKVLRLKRAVYGLRISGKKWEEDIRKVLSAVGLRPCPEDPALYTDGHVVVMVFVDDFLAIYHASQTDHANCIRQSLEEKFEMKHIGELSQFVEIRITRHRPSRKTWLSQGAYIEKIASKFNLLARQPPATPLPSDLSAILRPAPTEHPPNPRLVNLYQQKCGSTLYPAIWTRPETAFANQLLACSLTRCTDRHLEAVDHLISYLYGTKDLAICFDGQKETTVYTACSDASFADNTDRKSSEGFLFCLFGGPIDWKARKQKTVTTSTTEAELLTLSHAAKQSYWIRRLFKFIRFDPGHQDVMQCDNKQTIDLLTRERSIFQTKLRHVDIHQLWIRQEDQAKRLRIEWLNSSDLPADGLTKPLSRHKHEIFVRQMGMEYLPHDLM